MSRASWRMIAWLDRRDLLLGADHLAADLGTGRDPGAGGEDRVEDGGPGADPAAAVQDRAGDGGPGADLALGADDGAGADALGRAGNLGARVDQHPARARLDRGAHPPLQDVPGRRQVALRRADV